MVSDGIILVIIRLEIQTMVKLLKSSNINRGYLSPSNTPKNINIKNVYFRKLIFNEQSAVEKIGLFRFEEGIRIFIAKN